ncbi:MAG: segregation/condensation protein A, partial [Firmicutes bacterium]|nr:segregation/condensation protein A [Bacillota bacterium]
MDINFKLDAFEGPMELLLHLIAKNKMNIYDIPIAELTDQYLECIDMLDITSMESMSEFIVMASTLLEIKSRMLLPKPEEDEEEEQDPREALIARL